VKDYGFMLRTDPAYADKAAAVSAKARDVSEYVSEFLAKLPLRRANPPALTVAFHSACSLQHGQRVHREPRQILSDLGFTVRDIAEGHLCCGSAGTYNILQPEIARRLRDRKIGHIEKVQPDVIATGNIGCMTQIATGTAIPVVHVAELIDWATGGPVPQALEGQYA
jgi:glycolate oxidase iron-sulfur subunit